jgi:glycosyltransferase involved in cell wall biosynthesis
MPHFSLVVATKDRTMELARLLGSLACQETRDFEVIIVDQNPDDRLCKLLSDWSIQVNRAGQNGEKPINITHLRCSPGLSRARNLGLAHSSGDILAFPDDDCWYPNDTLQRVEEWFRHNKRYGILSVASRDEGGRTSGNRWPQSNCDLNRLNVFRASVSYALFVRRPTTPMTLHFDESLGLGAGTKFGAGEDTDFVLRLMGQGILGRFVSRISVGHPLKGYANAQRASLYGQGWGRLLNKHSLPVHCLAFVSLDLARAAIRLTLGDRRGATMLWAHGTGIISSYFSGRV